jgi:hypothetical protein
MALGTSQVRPGDWLWNVTGSGSKIGKKFEKPYRYINRGFSPGTGMIRRKDKTSVPNYRMTPEANRRILRFLTINSSEPDDQNTPTSTASSGRFRSADYSC